MAQAIAATAQRIGVNPLDLATAISYETAGTFDPQKAGPVTQWGQHKGLIQWGEPQAKQYGVGPDTTVPQQMEAVGRYLVDRGVKPGHGLMDIYSAINAGGVGLYNRSDANNGGAPGTVADKVNYQMSGHRAKAEKLLAGMTGAAASAPSAPQATPQAQPAPAPSVPGAPMPIFPQQAQQSAPSFGMQAAPQQQAAAPSLFEQMPADAGGAPPPPIFAGKKKPIDLSQLRAALQASGNRRGLFLE